MERVPTWAWGLGIVLFGALGVWSATDGNWSGLIAGVLLVGLCSYGLLQARGTR